MKNKRDTAVEYFSQKMHCSQAVLAAFSEECGILEEQAFKLGSCLGVACVKAKFAERVPELSWFWDCCMDRAISEIRMNDRDQTGLMIS